MSKTADSIPMFFHHMLADLALGEGWDMEKEEDMYTLIQPFHNTVMFSLNTDSTVSVTVGDLVELSKGKLDNANFKAFSKGLLELIQSDEENSEMSGTTPLMTSMHSGSSDYFTYEMLQDYVEKF